MHSKALTFMSTITFLAVLAVQLPMRLAAEDEKERKQPRYKLIDLGTFGGPHSYGSVNGDGISLINNSGVVASFADTALPDPNTPLCFVPDCFLAHAFRWRNGVKTDLGALKRMNSSAAGSINNRDWITGQSENGKIDPLLGFPEVRAVLWKHHHIINLGTLGGEESLGVYVNDHGQVVGISDNAVPDPFSMFGIGVQIRTFVWDDGVIQDIGTLGGPDSVPGASCNNQREGLIVGASYTSFTPNEATGIPTQDPFLWKNGKMIDLGNLGGTLSFAQCANNRGEVIGMSNLAGDVVGHAFLWRHGVIKDLGTLGGITPRQSGSTMPVTLLARRISRETTFMMQSSGGTVKVWILGLYQAIRAAAAAESIPGDKSWAGLPIATTSCAHSCGRRADQCSI